MSYPNINEKLKYTLKKFLEPNYIVTDDMYLEKLLVFLSGEGTNIYLPICNEWIVDVLRLWKETPRQSSFTSFILRVVGLVVSEKKGFKALQKDDAISRIIELMDLNNASDVSIKLAYITMLSSLANHDYGCDFLVHSELWKKVIFYCYENTSIYVTRESRKFMTTLLSSLADDDIDACECILSYTLKPLIIKDLKDSTHEDLKRKRFKSDDHLLPVVDMATHIFETSLFDAQTSIPQLILDTYDMEATALNLLNSANEIQMIKTLSRLLMLMYFTMLQNSAKNNEVTSLDFRRFEGKFYNLIQSLLLKDVKSCTNLVVEAQFIWHKLTLTVIYESEKDKQFKFENQLTILQLIPIFSSIKHNVNESECFDIYCTKLFDNMVEVTQRLAYLFRDTVKAQDNRPELLQNAVLTLLQVRDILHRDQATIVFQALMYKLKDFVPEVFADPRYKGPSSDEIVVLYPEILSSILEVISGLISCFHITWRESLETICIFAFMNQLLKNPNLSSKLAVKTLQLMQHVIQNFMPPNLALLVNTLDGSSINQLGPSLFRRMHDVSWEVRDSALEVLSVVTTISELKFTAFQDHILENELCSLCVLMAVDDLESYVRASALSCLCAMVRVDKFWSQCLSGQNLPLKMINTLKHEAEGIVRREAAALMKELYEHNKIPKSLQDRVFKAMVDASVKDLYWEVQINALAFWQKVIDQQMSNQGMIDGVFPPVTFSSKKKIVTLTDREIQFRLRRALQELGQLGCLQVLIKSLEDCNPQVVTKASGIISYITQLLSQHNILPVRNEVPETSLPDVVSSSVKNEARKSRIVPVWDTFGAEYSKSFDSYRPASKIARLVRNGEVTSCGISEIENNEAQMESSERVIDAIVNENDISLLQRVVQDQMNISVQDDNKPKDQFISTDEFLVKLSNLNLSDYLTEKGEWINCCRDDLGSLLDDILASSVGRESNFIDCY